MILAIDSSIGSAVAVVDPATEEVLGQAQSETSRGHAEVIGSLIQQALADAGKTPADITAVAAGMGPGPFTGLRIGIAAARAFAIGRGIPVVPVASHDAAALEILAENPVAEFVVVTDARRRENAVSAYTGLENGLPHRVKGPDLLPNNEDPLTFLGGDSASVDSPAPHTERIPAGALGILAARMLAAGTVAPLEPLYLRAPDAKIPGAVKRVST